MIKKKHNSAYAHFIIIINKAHSHLIFLPRLTERDFSLCQMSTLIHPHTTHNTTEKKNALSTLCPEGVIDKTFFLLCQHSVLLMEKKRVKKTKLHNMKKSLCQRSAVNEQNQKIVGLAN
jgi:hypothetical protein